jgi:hypothetical protein
MISERLGDRIKMEVRADFYFILNFYSKSIGFEEFVLFEFITLISGFRFEELGKNWWWGGYLYPPTI